MPQTQSFQSDAKAVQTTIPSISSAHQYLLRMRGSERLARAASRQDSESDLETELEAHLSSDYRPGFIFSAESSTVAISASAAELALFPRPPWNEPLEGSVLQALPTALHTSKQTDMLCIQVVRASSLPGAFVRLCCLHYSSPTHSICLHDYTTLSLRLTVNLHSRRLNDQSGRDAW